MEKSFSAAVNAERLRGQAAGLYIDRKEIRTGSIDTMSREEVLKQLKEEERVELSRLIQGCQIINPKKPSN